MFTVKVRIIIIIKHSILSDNLNFDHDKIKRNMDRKIK